MCVVILIVVSSHFGSLCILCAWKTINTSCSLHRHITILSTQICPWVAKRRQEEMWLKAFFFPWNSQIYYRNSVTGIYRQLNSSFNGWVQISSCVTISVVFVVVVGIFLFWLIVDNSPSRYVYYSQMFILAQYTWIHTNTLQIRTQHVFFRLLTVEPTK